MENDYWQFDLALVGAADDDGCLSDPMYNIVLGNLQRDTEKALKEGLGRKVDRLHSVFWEHTDNTLRVFGSNIIEIENCYAFRLRSHPVFEVVLRVNEELKLITATCGSDALFFENHWTDAMPFVNAIYEHYLVNLVRRLREIESEWRKASPVSAGN